MKRNYYIDYNTGAGNRWFYGTLEEAKKLAEEGIGYTQRNVEIYDAGEEYIGLDCEVSLKNAGVVAFLPWYGFQHDENDYVTASYDGFGFYGSWIDME